MSWKEIAWNGVRFSVPVDWEVAKIGPRHLMLAAQGKPVLEIKWERVKGPFSHRRALQRLRARYGGTVRECPLPERWERLLADFTVTGFTWQAEVMGGEGAILYCPACGNATLMQFFRHNAAFDQGSETCLHLLASFRDHNPDDQVPWSIFDIRAVIPAEFQLVRHRFEPGLFEMNFGSKNRRLTLYRWGPASVLLADAAGLAQFAARTIRIQPSEMRPLVWTGYDAAQWEQGVVSGRWSRWRARIMGLPFSQWYRFWHLVEKNRILGVEATGDKPFHPDLLERICREYESL